MQARHGHCGSKGPGGLGVMGGRRPNHGQRRGVQTQVQGLRDVERAPTVDAKPWPHGCPLPVGVTGPCQQAVSRCWYYKEFFGLIIWPWLLQSFVLL